MGVTQIYYYGTALGHTVIQGNPVSSFSALLFHMIAFCKDIADIFLQDDLGARKLFHSY